MDGPDGRVSLPALVEELGARRIQDVLIEGGPTLAWSAVAEGVADRLVVYLAPTLLGAGPGMFEGGVATLAQALPVRITGVERIGEDLRVEADVHRDR